MESTVHLWYLTELFLERDISRTKVVEKNKKHLMFSVYFLFENRDFLDNEEKYGTYGQDTQDNIMLRRRDALCLPDS
jgi:hypothetical protein